MISVSLQEFALCKQLDKAITWHGIPSPKRSEMQKFIFDILAISDNYNDFMENVRHQYRDDRYSQALGYAMMFAGSLLSMHVIIQNANDIRDKKKRR